MLLFVFCLMIPEDRNYHFHALRLSNMLLFSEFLFILLLAPTVLCLAATNITTNQLLRDGDTLISASQDFVLGFFSPDNSTSRYVGIWYNNIPVQTVVWVANRNMPISNKDGVIEIGDDGNLVIRDGNSSSGNVYWSSNVSFVASNSSVAVLLDSGNLVLSSSSSVGDTDKAYWQSFNNPTDVFLPEMQVLVNHAVGENRAFTSWNSANDPTLGRYSMGIDPRGSPQIVIWGGSDRQWRSGYWNGLVFTGMQNTTSNYLHGFKLRTEDSKGNMYFSYTPMNSSHIVRFEITWDGIGKQWIWDPRISDWGLMQEQPDNACEFYNKCGNFGRCNVEDSSICNCLEGFEPKDSVEWNRGNWSGGCVIKLPLQCEVNGSKTDGFYKMNNAKLPDFANSVTASNADECEEKCLLNCSCTAYAMDSGFGCLIWSGDLVDIQQLSANGKILYLRLSNSELGGRIKLSNTSIIAISLSVAAFTSICIWLLWSFRNSLKGSWKSNSSKLFYKTSKRREVSTDNQGSGDLFGGTNERNAPEFPLFSFNAVAVATDNFSETNVLGRGGFGPVYKGKLPSGEVVAVKKLSGKSLQGFEEFENEIMLIAKLQHRNLVRLLGWCIEEEEKILIYEYLPNKSLDYFLFAPAKRSQLDWAIRFKIIEGIARGLLYLHRDSRLTIIHRDLKASNILLDEEMNPKISDFGMARIFRGNEDELNTVRVVGTYGYMSPEYAMEGLFSVKSDVYSFGVLLLEIVSGRRNGSFQSTGKFNLVRFAWNAWTEGTPLKLVDPSLGESYSRKKVLRCIHIAMLCVQDSGSQRPPMSAVVLMLESETTTLPSPKHPIFTSVQGSEDTERWSELQDIATSNSMSFEMASGG